MSVSQITIEGEPLFLTCDFKDIDLFYKFYLRYYSAIHPAISKIWATPAKTDAQSQQEKE